jgi:hypothetical protein
MKKFEEPEIGKKVKQSYKYGGSPFRGGSPYLAFGLSD